MSKHSPGPWEVLEAFTADRPITIAEVNAPHNDIANVYSADDATVSITREQAIANARLIAEAPNLLEIAKRTVMMLDGVDSPLGIAAREAVAKATGAKP